MTYSNVEPIVYGIAARIAILLPTYLTATNAETNAALYPSDTHYPSIFTVPDTSYSAEALKKAAVATSIPATGPFPYMMVNLDGVDYEEIGQNSDLITMRVSLVVALSESKDAKLGHALMRYMDALHKCIAANLTLGGLVQHIKIATIDKQQLAGDKAGFVVADLVATIESVNE